MVRLGETCLNQEVHTLFFWKSDYVVHLYLIVNLLITVSLPIHFSYFEPMTIRTWTFLTSMNDILFIKENPPFLFCWKYQLFTANSWLDSFINHQRLRCETVNINKISINLNYQPSRCDRIQIIICTICDIH